MRVPTHDDDVPPQVFPAPRTGLRRARGQRAVPGALGVFVVVLVSLQIFLLTVAVDGLLAGDSGLAWVTAVLSVLLAAGTAAFYRYLR